MKRKLDWSKATGDVWARRWRDTDRALGPVGAALDEAVLDAAPRASFDAIDIGCGPGASTIALASARPDARILACDLSQALVEIAARRASRNHRIRFAIGDAVVAAKDNGPFDLFLSRHGVMFFDDPAAAFRSFRDCARDDAALVFSCFQAWHLNDWAWGLANAAAGAKLPAPGREPSGFAFADPAYVSSLLESAGWRPAEPQPIQFDYEAAEGDDAVEQGLSFFAELGPASAALSGLPDEERELGLERMRQVIEDHRTGDAIRFPAAAWIWRALAA